MTIYHILISLNVFFLLCSTGLVATGCLPSGKLVCENGKKYLTYTCSPPVTSSTAAKLTLNDFSPGGVGVAKTDCDAAQHQNTELIVALSTGWYANGTRCLKDINITANGLSTTAKVVDECDSVHGCDPAYAYLPPCANNIIEGSAAVWNALELNKSHGIVNITWSMV